MSGVLTGTTLVSDQYARAVFCRNLPVMLRQVFSN